MSLKPPFSVIAGRPSGPAGRARDASGGPEPRREAAWRARTGCTARAERWIQAEAGLTVLVAARDEEGRIGALVARLSEALPDAAIVVADDGSRDRTAEEARRAGATVVSCPRLGKGEALTAGERAAPPGPLLLCDADLEGDLEPLAGLDADLAIAVFAERAGGGFGVAKRAATRLVRARSGFEAREPLSGQRYVGERARAVCFPLARGFGCEVRMTIDAVRAGLEVTEVELSLRHRPTGRNVAGFLHRGRQLAEAALACGPLAVNHRGNRLPLVGALVALAGLAASRRTGLAVAAVAAAGLVDDLRSGGERGFGGHLRAGRTTGVLKAVAIPAVGLAATRSVGGALVVGLSANALNQLDTKPGRALKAFLAGAVALGRRGQTFRSRNCSDERPDPLTGVAPYAGVAVLLLPYDLRERVMLGDAGSNALGAVLGLALVTRLGGRERWQAALVLAALNALGDRISLGRLIERAPLVAELDRAGRVGAP